MKNQTLFSLVICLLISSFQLSAQTRNVGDFDAVHISKSITATLVKANSPSVEYTMKKGSADDLVTKVKDGTLYVKTKSDKMGWGNNTQAVVTVYYTDIDDITVTSGCTVKSDNTIRATKMDIEVSSGSTAKLEVEAEKVNVEVSSGSTLKLKGEAEKGKFEARSGSTLNAYHFETEIANVKARSGSSLSIHVDDTLDAKANSGSSISYTGSAKNKNIDAGHSASIRRKN